MAEPARPRRAPAPALDLQACGPGDPARFEDWLALRRRLWPHATPAEHRAEMESFLAAPQRFFQVLAYVGGTEGGEAGARRAVGLAEAAVRHDYVNGTEGSPVAFLEGLYVLPAQRRRGAARQLVQAVQAWAGAQGLTELASDTPLDNLTSQAAHRGLGFEETERVVYFRKAIPPQR